MDLKQTIRGIPDHPKPGILFRDVTTLMGNPGAFVHAIDLLAEAYKSRDIDKVAGIEARGFIFGAALADRLRTGFVPVRKAGKLPADTYEQSYDLEYGQDTLEIHKDSIEPGTRVLVVDDLLATGGTALAAIELLRKAGAEIVAGAFIVDLPELKGRERIEAAGYEVMTLVEFEGH
jgi:adenine phosphoribosyltransferase